MRPDDLRGLPNFQNILVDNILGPFLGSFSSFGTDFAIHQTAIGLLARLQPRGVRVDRGYLQAGNADGGDVFDRLVGGRGTEIDFT